MIRTVTYIALITTMLFFSCDSASTWEDAREADSYEAYRAYIDDNPNGEHLNEARNRADSLYWVSVSDDTTVAPVEGYLEQFPEGRYRTEAQTKLDLLRSDRYPAPARVTGSNVIIRSDHTTASSSAGVVSRSGTEVEVIGQYLSENSSEVLLNRTVTVNVINATVELDRGKALRIREDRGDSVLASFSSPATGRAEAIFSKSDIEAMGGQTWYKIRTRDGITGWIYGRFIEMLD